MRLGGLFVYPVKSMRAVAASQAEVEACGLAADRRWMLVDAQGGFLSQRQLPHLARFTAWPDADGLRLRLGAEDIWIARPGAAGERIVVSLWRSRVRATRACPGADAWLSARLGQPCRLVYLDDPCARPIESPHGAPGEHVSFADGFPALLTTQASLAALNDALATPVGMDRFRPNLVIDGAAPWAEHDWGGLRIGAVAFRAPKPCTRCVMTTIDQSSGEIRQAGEPLRTLRRLNRQPEGVVFGVNLTPLSTGLLRIGDHVEILSARQASRAGTSVPS